MYAYLSNAEFVFSIVFTMSFLKTFGTIYYSPLVYKVGQYVYSSKSCLNTGS